MGDEAFEPWTEPAPIGWGSAYGLATVGDSTALLVYGDHRETVNGIVIERSTDSGTTWGDPFLIASSLGPAAIAAFENDVDVVWSQSDALCYTRSADGGVTFGPSMVLATSVVLDPYGRTLSVGRGPNGAVAVIWEDDSLRAIVSTDGGLSFGEAFTVASGAGHGPAVAVGDGVVYVAYTEDVQLLVRRSLDGGSTWTVPDSLGKVVPDTFWDPALASITADGANAYIAYDVETQPNSFIRYRQTTNSGQTWSKPVNLSPPSDRRLYSELPVITQQDGTIHVAYGRCNFWFEGACDLGTGWSSELVYRHSNNGIDWSRGETVVDGFPGRVLPVALGVAGRVMAFYSLEIGGWLVTTREL